jgi:probable selenium-dependent hydroxylase accessory protein YqeC
MPRGRTWGPEGPAPDPVNLAKALLPLLPGGKGVIAFVGAGGKTSALFRLAKDMAGQGLCVLATATTHLMDPRSEPGRPTFELLLRPDMEFPSMFPSKSPTIIEARPGLTVVLSREAEPPGKLKGVHPSWIPELRASWDLILVEADGSKRMPVKAPGSHEPVIPPSTDLVVGVVGLDCLGRPMDGGTVHRPDHFSAITGCMTGEPIAWHHLVALVRHPEGLFKQAAGARVILLNKVDKALSIPSVAQVEALPADLVLLASLEPAGRNIVIHPGRRV